jgi:hypothetical protein
LARRGLDGVPGKRFLRPGEAVFSRKPQENRDFGKVFDLASRMQREEIDAGDQPPSSELRSILEGGERAFRSLIFIFLRSP